VKFEAPRGTHDILPSEQPQWQRVLAEAEDVCRIYGYRRIQTPGFEDTEVFQRTSGAGSDVVRKEMYTFTDGGGRSLTLRPEGTAPIVRAYLEHGMHREPQPVKLYTVAPMYRYAAPQRGRYREHWQLSVEAIGSADPAVDAELIQLYAELLRRLGVTRYELQLNSIGDRECRPAYLERLNAWLDAHADSLDEDAREKRATSPLRVFDTKNVAVAEALSDAPKIGESLCDACRAHFAEVRRLLDAYGVGYTLVPTLVRGLDYYTRTAFEFVDEAIGAQSSICGGGRYDYLAEELGGDPTPGMGFGAGIERLLLSLEGDAGAEQPPVDVFLAVEPGTERETLLALMTRLRATGRSADTDYAQRSLKGQLTQAQRLNAETVVIARADGFTVRRRGEQDREFGTLAEVSDALA
jgi:histidyl-tRNA synthetase